MKNWETYYYKWSLHAQIAAERGAFDINDVVARISAKLIRRHPHVFGSQSARNSRDVVLLWDRIKAEEREGAPPKGLLASVPMSLPALMRAAKLQKRLPAQVLTGPITTAPWTRCARN